MKREAGLAAVALMVAVGTLGTLSAQSQGRRYSATLESGQENPALSAPGGGVILLDIDEAAGEISYVLAYQGLSDVRQAHIHFEKPALNGGIMLWLCKSPTNQGPTPATTPDCPPEAGTVSGTLVATDVLAIANQKLTAGDFASAVAQIRGGFAYANVHTGANPGGQIRGQIGQGGDRR
jgi:hypothetical protein